MPTNSSDQQCGSDRRRSIRTVSTTSARRGPVPCGRRPGGGLTRAFHEATADVSLAQGPAATGRAGFFVDGVVPLLLSGTSRTGALAGTPRAALAADQNRLFLAERAASVRRTERTRRDRRRRPAAVRYTRRRSEPIPRRAVPPESRVPSWTCVGRRRWPIPRRDADGRIRRRRQWPLARLRHDRRRRDQWTFRPLHGGNVNRRFGRVLGCRIPRDCARWSSRRRSPPASAAGAAAAAAAGARTGRASGARGPTHDWDPPRAPRRLNLRAASREPCS